MLSTLCLGPSRLHNYAPTLQDAEFKLCHPKRCGQPKPRTVVKGTESATLANPDDPDEPNGHQCPDPDPEQLMLPEWVDVKDALMHSEAYAVTGQQEAPCTTAQPIESTPSSPGCQLRHHGQWHYHYVMGWGEVGIDCIIAGEKSKTARTRKLFLAGPMCVDFCKPGLLPDRESYKAPKTPPGQDPRPGLDGKYGMSFRVNIKIWGWVQKHHPECRFFIENFVFDVMKEDWDEVWREGLTPRNPDTCMDPGRTVLTYPAFGKDCVSPLGESWSDGPEDPVANTGQPLLVNDQAGDETHHVRPHEADQLMGIDAGTTAGPGITANHQLQAIGGGWDINVTSVLLKHLKPRSVQAYTHMYLAKLATSATTTDMK